jgi:16S rRNA (adenine1518-N6/adenine1519-N6)-dimethyltransferase
MAVSFFLRQIMTRTSNSRQRQADDAPHIPRKRFGQHFLTDQNILRKITRAAEIQPTDTVLEIGPGLGDLTRALSAAAARVVAVEVDRDLTARLRAEFSNTNTTIFEGDVLRQTPEAWLAQAHCQPPYLVVANLPYYITSAILRYLLEASIPPTRIVVMTQREVAQQMTARPPHSNLLAVSVQYYAAPRIVEIVPAGAFRPPPQVASAIVRLDVQPRNASVEVERFFRVVRAGFSAKRKQIHNALANGSSLSRAETAEWLRRAEIAPTRRAETLSIAEWERLAQQFQTRRLV